MQVDLTDYTSADLSFHRFLDDNLLTGSHLTVAVKANRTYKTLASWDEKDGDKVWHYTTYSLDEYAGKEVTVRFTAKANTPLDLSSLFGGTATKTSMAMDNVTIQGVRVNDTPDLIVQRVSVDKDTVDGGGTVKLKYAVKNTGIAAIRNSVVSVYRHDNETDTPATGEPVTTSTRAHIGARGGYGTAVTVRTPSVPEDTVVYYYVCVSSADTEHCGDPVTVTVKKTEVPAETPEEMPETVNLVVHGVSVDKDTADGGTAVRIRFTIRNDGTASLRGTVHVYRHDTKTNIPSAGGER